MWRVVETRLYFAAADVFAVGEPQHGDMPAMFVCVTSFDSNTGG
jgi:hypothetical protein